MSFLIDLISGGWAKLAGILGVVGALAAGWLSIRKSGRDAERARALTAQQERVTDANQARAGTAGLSDDQLDDELRARPRGR